MYELNLDQAPQDINKEEFQLESVRLQAFVAATDPGCKKELKRSGSLGSFAMREKGGNRLVPGLDCIVDALKLPNQAPRVSGESLLTSVAWRCPDGTLHLFC
ncbi:hypothetical protein TNCV_3949511 [Trichonephila clavipes]|nr:hypothetical protein TNCV_3949511 [Trichonephila clavipes]